MLPVAVNPHRLFLSARREQLDAGVFLPALRGVNFRKLAALGGVVPVENRDEFARRAWPITVGYHDLLP